MVASQKPLHSYALRQVLSAMEGIIITESLALWKLKHLVLLKLDSGLSACDALILTKNG